MTKIQFALLAAVLGLATMGGAGYYAYANSAPHKSGADGATASGQPSGGGAGGAVELPTDGASAPTGDVSDAGTNGSGGGSACQNGDVQVSESAGQGAAGHVSLLLVFQNVSGHLCTLHGYPGASITAQDGTDLLDAKRTLSGYLGGAVGLKKAPVISLAAGERASAVLEWSDVDSGSGCTPTNQANLVVTPPNFTQSSTLSIAKGTEICSGFQIHPVLKGVVSEPAGAGN